MTESSAVLIGRTWDRDAAREARRRLEASGIRVYLSIEEAKDRGGLYAGHRWGLPVERIKEIHGIHVARESEALARELLAETSIELVSFSQDEPPSAHKRTVKERWLFAAWIAVIALIIVLV